VPFEIPDNLHPDVMGVAWLLGRWEGSGKSSYPDTEDIDFGQQIDFAQNGGNYLHYLSQTFTVDANRGRIAKLEDQHPEQRLEQHGLHHDAEPEPDELQALRGLRACEPLGDVADEHEQADHEQPVPAALEGPAREPETGLRHEAHHAPGEDGERSECDAEQTVGLAQERDAVADTQGRDSASDRTHSSRLSECHREPAFHLLLARFTSAQADTSRRDAMSRPCGPRSAPSRPAHLAAGMRRGRDRFGGPYQARTRYASSDSQHVSLPR